MLDFEFLKQSASVLADAAVKTTKDLTDKGKHKMDVLAAERHLAKTQRQLGALVYSLHKNGESNDQLVKKYLQAVAQAEKQLAQVTAEQAEESRDVRMEKICMRCGAEVSKDATFCSCCGQKFESADDTRGGVRHTEK